MKSVNICNEGTEPDESECTKLKWTEMKWHGTNGNTMTGNKRTWKKQRPIDMNEWTNKQVNGIDWHYLVKWNESTQNEVKWIIASMNEMI